MEDNLNSKSIVENVQGYEQDIHKDWSDLQKALYVYARMITDYDMSNPEDSKVFARSYEQMMNKLNIPCRYVENNQENYAWNEICIDGTYYPVDISMDSRNSRKEGPGAILVHNFGKNADFYNYPEHKIAEIPKEFKTLDRELVQKSFNVIIDQIGIDQNKKVEKIRENVKIELHSKELKGAFEGDTVTLDSLKELKPLKINLQDADVEELANELRTIGIYYPEILDNVEIENTSSAPTNIQTVLDDIYEARTVGSNLVIDPINITIASQFEKDFELDLSHVPEVADTPTSRVDGMQKGQSITFRNTNSSKQLHAPVFTEKVSDNLTGMAFEGFDLAGLDLRDTKVRNLTFNASTNVDQIDVETTVSYAIQLEALSTADLNSALTNFAIHDLSIKNIDLHDRAILQELSRNPDLVKIKITNAHLNNLDGLEDFDGRLYSLNIQANDLVVDDIERVERFRKTNPYLDFYLSNNHYIVDYIRSLPRISDESYRFIANYNQKTGDVYKVTNKERALDYLLWSHPTVPYYIKDAELIRNRLKITSNPMMVENDLELDNFDFEQAYLRDGILYLTPAQVEHLITTGKTVPQNIRLKLESVADLSIAELNNLTSRANALGINITEVQIMDANAHNNHNQIVPYTVSQYAFIRDSLDIITDGILDTDSDIDKFATVYQRLMDNISYDHDAVKEGNSAEAKYYAEKRDSSRNLLQGLEEGQCVCSGYADILRNALIMVGLNAENVSGYTKYDSSGNPAGFHAWNRVELADSTGTKKWYNTDLTWCAHRPYPAVEKVTLRGDVPDFNTKHMLNSTSEPTVSATDFDRALMRDAFNRAKTKSFNMKDKLLEIDIPEDPVLNVEILDRDRVLQEYNRRKDDMCAKFYGDKDYQREYMERSRRFRAHEIEDTSGRYAFRKIEDYPERESDEQFLLLDKYSECLERMTKYQAGDTSVYTGTPDQISKALEKDKEYVETRNHTFNKNKDMRNNLATLGKFGERVPYIPRQKGLIRNAGRVVLNAGILARNVVAPVYRGIGRFVAQPIHRLVVGDRDASPFRNNWYHRMVARRDYFTEKNNTDRPDHAITNSIKSRFDAVFKYKEGNQAVLNAGAAEIQSNIIEQELERNMIHSLEVQSSDFERQIQDLQNAITARPKAPNLLAVQTALADKISKKADIDKKIDTIKNNKTGIAQTDAISDAQHDIAVKEEVTLKTTVIKGFVKGLAVKYVGPKIHEWLSKRGTTTVTEQVTTKVPVEKQRWVDPTYKTENVPIYEDVVDTSKSMTDMMQANGGKTVTGFYSVYGGERNPASYTLTGNENITAIFQAKGSGGTGLSDVVGLKAPTIVDRTFGSDMLTANGLLNQNLSIDQIMTAVNNGSLDPSALSDMYVSIGDQYWTKLSDLTSSLTSQVQTGSTLKKVLDVAGHYEKYTDYIDSVKNVTHTVIDQRIAQLDKISSALFKAGVAVDSGIDLAENVRNTRTDVKDNKANPKNFKFNPIEPMPTSRKEYKDQRERD